jgi:hypothetical protein
MQRLTSGGGSGGGGGAGVCGVVLTKVFRHEKTRNKLNKPPSLHRDPPRSSRGAHSCARRHGHDRGHEQVQSA